MTQDPPSSITFNGRTYFLARNRYYCCGRRKGQTGPTNLHRAIWEDANGPVPDGCQIHHKDGDPLNNALDNLECVDARKHNSDHYRRRIADGTLDVEALRVRGREAAKEWHASPEGREWHRQGALKRWDRPSQAFQCDRCGGSYEAPFKGRHRFCGPNCYREAENEQRRARYAARHVP